jgi:hypothetical protein
MGALGWPIAFAFPAKAGPAEVAVDLASAGFDADGCVFVAVVAGVFGWVCATTADTMLIIAMRRKIPIRWNGSDCTRVLSLKILFSVF